MHALSTKPKRREKSSPLGMSLALGSALATFLNAGNANALSCTFGNFAGCAGTVGNLTFGGFSASGNFENDDTLTITLNSSGIYNILAVFNAAGGVNLSGSGNYGFTVTAAPGFSLDQAAVNSTVDLIGTGGPFTFTNNLSGFTPSPLVSTGGSSAVGVSSSNSSTVLIAWNNGGGSKTAQSSLLQLTTNPPTDPQSVPGPLPLFGAATAFGFSRRMRQRTKARA